MTARLQVDDLQTGYGRVTVVHGLTLSLDAGSVLALLGPNGAGKTTTLLSLAGMLPIQAGSVQVDGLPLPTNPTQVNRKGVTLVPDDRALFPSLSVAEHLELACQNVATDARDMLDVFPALEARWAIAAGALSGGEQQMLAVARGLAQEPKVLLIDEMSMGLAPVIVESLLPVVRRAAAERDAAVVIVEQHVALALDVADRAIVMTHGAVVLDGEAEEIAADQPALERAYLS